MTTLAAIQGESWVVIGADTQVSDDSGFKMQLAASKIFKNGCALIAGAGSMRGINILQFGWTAPKYSGKTIEHYLTQQFIPSMRAIFIESGYDIKTAADAATCDNVFIVAIKGKLFAIDEDYSWEHCNKGLYVAGSGSHFALGALDAFGAKKVKTPEQAQSVIRKSIAVATNWDAFSGGVIQTFIQKS